MRFGFGAIKLFRSVRIACVGFQHAKVSAWDSERRRAEDVKNILLIKADHIGDFVLALQAFKILRQGFPQAVLTLLCGPWNKDFAAATGLFERIVCVDIFPEISGRATGNVAFDPVPLLNAGLPKFDIAIDLKVESETRFLLNYIKADFKAGFRASPLPPDMNFVLPIPARTIYGRSNEARHTRTLLSLLVGAVVGLFDSQRSMIEALEAIAAKSPPVPVIPRDHGPIVGINVGSGAATRNWPLESFVELVKNLAARKKVTLVLFGSKQQQPDNAQILSAVPEQGNIIDLAGQVSLIQFEALLKEVDLYIGHDTGSTHMAASIGRPTLCLHSGVTPLENFGPLGEKVTVIKTLHLPCSPCGLKDLTQCGYDHRCMRSITADDVMKEIVRIVPSLG